MSTSGNNDENPTRKGKDENLTRKGKGRQKVNMVKMENESNLQVTFSKRRNGMFKKASELNTRCGAESVLVVFSPGGKPYSFGHPNVETIATRFLGENDHNPPPRDDQLFSLQQFERQMMANATMELNQVEDQLDLVKNQAKKVEQMLKQVDKIKQMENFNYQLFDQLKEEVFDFKGKLGTNQIGKDQSFSTAPYFLGPNPNLGAVENFQPIGPSASSFDPRFYSNLQEMPSHFPHFFGSGGNNIFDNNVSLISDNPSFGGTSTFRSPDYASMWNASSSFVIPYTPVATDPTAIIPINPPEDEPSGVPRNNAGGVCNDDDE